jgi:hypothetical protein
MKQNEPVRWLQAIRSHRGIYRFGGPWAQAVMYSVPWINALILFALLFLYHQRITISPGIVFDLPKNPGPVRRRWSSLMTPASWLKITTKWPS